MAEGNVLALQTKLKLRSVVTYICFIISFLCLIRNVLSSGDCNGLACHHGTCVQNNTVCQCFDGWAGDSCDHCSGRVRLTTRNGIITDGSGNYSEDNKCMWLIETNTTKPEPIHMLTNQFATECGWDHVYVFDGDSIFSPLIGAFSGLVQPNIDPNNTLTEVIATSGKVYVYFYSDAAYNMTGFNVQYTVGGCPMNCSDHGVCHGTKCQCDTGWKGDSCSLETCPNNCSGHGQCVDNLVCQCDDQHKGPACSLLLEEESWFSLETQNSPGGRASSASVLIGDDMWVAGGYSFDPDIDFLVRYNFPSKTWHAVNSTGPSTLYGHSVVTFKGNLYLYGGMIGKDMQSKLWIYNVSKNVWSSTEFNITKALVGHSAIVINDTMYIIFGHSAVYGYMNSVQEINLASETGRYEIVMPDMKGALIKGGYGHSSVYSEVTGEIYVHGGYRSGSITKYYLTDDLYSYNPKTKHWTILAGSGSPRYLHSAVLLGGIMLVFGGNTHNDTSISLGAKCYSPEFLAYDRVCNSWHHLSLADLPENAARFGHTAETYTDSDGKTRMYVFGGFTGVMLSDILEYTVGACSVYQNETQCLSAYPGQECVWADTLCLSKTEADRKNTTGEIQGYTRDRKCEPAKGAAQMCKQFKLCGSCLSSAYNCNWCSNNCSSTCPPSNQFSVTDVSKCPNKYKAICDKVHNCHKCILHSDCVWDAGGKECKFPDHSNFDQNSASEPIKCPQPCYTHTSCQMCTNNSCMWCGSQQRCVETNSYVASFLYGQCQEWTTQLNKCSATKCSSLKTCDECKTNPGCGWCNDVENTGLGKCVQGSGAGPVSMNVNTTEYEVDNSICPAERWHFVDCPLCQCNGHSKCTNKSDKCDQCKHPTEGDHCERCQKGYYGNPKNGQGCEVCQCNGQADVCDNVSGKCFCRTRGVKGDQCNECDTSNNYHGNPNNHGTCFYDLRTDYQFTFNLSKNEDKHYTGINFMNRPLASDRDVDFTVNCSGNALLNITYRSNSHPKEIPRVVQFRCMHFRSKFEHKDFNFGPDDNLTFHVYVYNFTTPFWLQISFSQFPKIDLVHFFVTFFSCFLSLLIIAAVLYKVKHKFDSYRRRQRMNMELEEMASRPFASAVIEIDRRFEGCAAEKKENSTDLRKRKRMSSKPGQVALEPLHNQKAAVISLFVQLPTGTEEWTPPGHSGMLIGSALVTMGNQRKQSLEHIKPDKGKHKKHTFSNQPDTCV